MSGLSISAATRKAQADASNPASSVFVAANAGSGKTFVLARRVVRLLVSGAAPSKILCLTYTKAAAAEMQGRIFAILSEWTRLSDADLRERLAELGGQAPAPGEIARARRLFATALETPGGLKVQTIHAFCEQLLHLFPLEAGVPGHFEVLDEAQSALLLAEARRRLIVSAVRKDDPSNAALSEAFAESLARGGEFGLDGLLSEIVAKRDAIRAHLNSQGGLEGAIRRLEAALDIRDGMGEDALLRDAIDPPGLDEDFRERLRELASASSKATDAKLLAKLERFETAETPSERFEALRSFLFKADGGRYKATSLATKAVTDALPDFAERVEEASDFAEELAERLATLRLFIATRAALVIAERLERDYQTLKRARARLDFEDLIVRAAELLSRGEAAAWVHYKLDRGIDHVLVDEAQDTSPRQWQVVRQLVEEFFQGPDSVSAERVRTLFAVGDEKQSIYSFQGASPAMFAQERLALERRAGDVGAPFARVALHQSFRSTADILEAVDLAFASEADRTGLSFENEPPVHSSARGRVPGLVEIWPPFEKEAARESDDWLTPIDEEPRSSPLVRLADRIAEQIRAWIGTPIEARGHLRPMTPGDVIVLVRKRSAFVGAMSAALRERRIPVAGADRLLITDHIAVEDLMALGRTVANAEDELSLASVLKSPLFGFSDDDLMALALSRRETSPESLYFALRRLAGEDGAERLPAFASDRTALLAKAKAAFDRLEELRRRIGFEGVFSFYARILGPEGGRLALTARLGRDSGEVIDAFLDLALTFESDGGADLDAFLETLQASPPTVRREMGEASGEVRIMTVHASKGLEAPVVFLVDPGSAPFSHAHGAKLIAWEGMPGLPPGAPPGFLWCPEKSLADFHVEALRASEKARAEEEYRRLLYVGMTRAADRLVLCGHSGSRGADENSWLKRVTASLEGHCERVLDAAGDLVALRRGALPAGEVATSFEHAGPGTTRIVDLSPLAPEAPPPRPLVPSDPAGTLRVEKDEEAGARSPVLYAGEPSLAIRRGLLVHRLLQVLPEMDEDAREAASRRYLETEAADLASGEREAMLGQVLAILSAPDFSALFSPGSRAEVGVRGTIELDGLSWPVSGLIDRLAVSADRVSIVDYKTNRPAPRTLEEVSPSYILQLALYRALLQPLYPDRTVVACLLFTEGPHLIDVPAAVMEDALAGLARRRATA